MSAVTFDTLKFAKRLETAGVPIPQAEAEALALQDALSESDLASKQDISELRHELRETKTEINGKLALMQWMLAAVLALAIANFAKQYF
jgi:hypothetical protein